MTQVTVEKRQFNNANGEVVNYNALVIRGTLNGKEQKIEKSVSNVEAMVIGMLLENNEQIETNSRKASEAEKEDFNQNNGLGFLED